MQGGSRIFERGGHLRSTSKKRGGPGWGPTLGPMLKSLYRGPKRGVRSPLEPPPPDPPMKWTTIALVLLEKWKIARLSCYNITFSSVDCLDYSPECPKWADGGECTSNPAYMIENCQKTCGFCEKSEFHFYKMSSSLLVKERTFWTAERVYT